MRVDFHDFSKDQMLQSRHVDRVYIDILDDRYMIYLDAFSGGGRDC